MAELLHKELTFAVIGAAMQVHRVLDNGFLGAVYQKALAHELCARNIVYQEQVRLLVINKGELVFGLPPF